MAKSKRKKQYEVDSKKKIVKANVKNLNQKEIQAVNNYVAIGYELVDTTIKAKSKGIYTKANIEKYIKAKGIKFDIKALSDELNEEGKKKGFIYAQRVFRKTYDDDYKEFLGI